MSPVKRIVGTVLCALLLAGCTQAQPDTTTAYQMPEIIKPEFKTVTTVRETFIWTQNIQQLSKDYYNKNSVVCEYDGAIITDTHKWKLGDTVKAGDVIATVSFEVDEIELDRLQLAYDRAVLAMNNGISSYYQSIASIKGDDRVSYLQRLSAEYQLGAFKLSAEQQCQEALEKLEEYKLRFEEMDIVSPYDGIICDVKKFSNGEVLSKGQILMTLADPDSLYYWTDNSDWAENTAGKQEDTYRSIFWHAAPGCNVQIGEQSASVVSSPFSVGGWFEGMQNAPTYFTLDDPKDADLIKQNTARITLLKLENMISLPLRAVHNQDTQPYVNILVNDTAVKRYVICGPRSLTEICILDGLEEGLQVILD